MKFIGCDKDEDGNLVINEKYNIGKLDYATVQNPFEGKKIIVTLLDGTEIECEIE